MCDHEHREGSMVVIDRAEDGTPTVWCDPCLFGLVNALNTCGIATVASCCGHGRRPGNIALADGRELVIMPDYDTARAADALWPDINAPTQGTGGCHDCGRSYGDEHGFPDLIVPDDVWLAISPRGDFGGLLCPSCICKRVHVAGLTNVEARFMSGPFANFYDHSWTPRPPDTLAPRRHADELAAP